jgi:hypothetical protein
MPIQYTRDDANQRILVTTSGQIRLDDIIATVDRQAKERTWSYAMLYDARAAASTPTMDEMKSLVLHIGKLTTAHGPRGPVALVTNGPLLERVVRVYASLGELTALNVRVFTALAEAERWLDSLSTNRRASA